MLVLFALEYIPNSFTRLFIVVYITIVKMPPFMPLYGSQQR